MNHLQAIAKAHYREGSERTKDSANRFFEAIKKDGNGKVDYVDFKEFMISKRHDYYVRRNLFDSLGNNGRLGFWEVMTLYYIINSRRPFCKKCDLFVTGDYFACVKCFESSRDPYCICLGCYKRPGTAYKHSSCDHPKFLDNCTMLEAARRLSAHQPRIEDPRRHTDRRSHSTEIVPSPTQHSRRSTSQSSQPIRNIDNARQLTGGIRRVRISIEN